MKLVIIFSHTCCDFIVERVVGSKAKGRTGVLRKQSTTNFPKSQHFEKRTCAYQGVRNVRFSGNLTSFVSLKHPFWDSIFCLITDECQLLLILEKRYNVPFHFSIAFVMFSVPPVGLYITFPIFRFSLFALLSLSDSVSAMNKKLLCKSKGFQNSSSWAGPLDKYMFKASNKNTVTTPVLYLLFAQ